MKIKTTSEIEIDVTFPAYFLHGGTEYKLLSATKGIGVTTDKGEESIHMVFYDSVIGIIVMNGKKSTPEAFESAYIHVITLFTHINEIPC